MRQAQFQAISQEIREIKQELREFIILMSTTELEKQNLEAHVDLCSERYKGLHDRLSAMQNFTVMQEILKKTTPA